MYCYIKDRMKQRKTTVDDFSKLIGMSFTSTSRKLLGDTPLTVKEFLIFAEALKIPARDYKLALTQFKDWREYFNKTGRAVY